MAVTELIEAPQTPQDVPQAPGPAPARRRRRTNALAWLLLFAAFAASVGWLAVEVVHRGASRPPGDGSAAVSAAEKQALAIMTLDYRHAKADLQRVIDGSTGTMRTQYAQGAAGQAATAESAKSVSTGTVLSAGLSYPSGHSSLTRDKAGDTAEVLVVGDATVSFPKTKSSPASKMAVHYRFVFQMHQVNGVWKSARLGFDGLPPYSQVAS